MHAAPYWSNGRARRMARTACFTLVVVTGSLAAGIPAGMATAAYVHPPAHMPPPPPSSGANHQPPSGAVVVGFSVAMLVFLGMRIGYVLYERRSSPNKKYGTRHHRGLTRREYLLVLGRAELVLAVACLAGLGWRHLYG